MLCALDERPRLTKFDGLEWRKRAVRASYQDELTLRSSQSFVFYIPPAVFDLEFESSLTLSTNFFLFPALAHQNNACSVECKSDAVGKKRRLNQRIDKLTDGFLP